MKLNIGSKTFDNALIQGPLAGVSCAAFRKLFSLYKEPAYSVTEMISSHDVIYKHKKSSRYLYRDANEGNLCYQLSGSNPAIFSQAAKIVEDLGADLIDINCGCPKPKIRKKGAGSALLEQPSLLAKIIATTRKAIAIPLTVKIRLQTQGDREIVQMIEQSGADAIIVHGRTWQDDYQTPSDLAKIAAIKQSVNIPVIANGDIKNKSSLSKVTNLTQCDGVMISRAGTGKPWLFSHLLDDLAPPNLEQVKSLFLQHVQALARLENEFKALLQSRSLAKYYFRDYIDMQQLQPFYHINSFDELERALKMLEPLATTVNT